MEQSIINLVIDLHEVFDKIYNTQYDIQIFWKNRKLKEIYSLQDYFAEIIIGFKKELKKEIKKDLKENKENEPISN